ncbi:fasciclin domain-containing protein [Flammeovirga sp. SubArs3]|uniref:fasciclin domain-containing protein n=1 Tax=Flammeovirga sp. SubArs3 TaxID=2995316 RepID=UPI00248BA3F7|nr:fasciclin domain-containing protein [Flammeovirga sp. SubArs3]
MRTINLFKIMLTIGLFGLFTSCSDDDNDNPTNLPAVEEVQTIAGIASSTDDFSTLTSALTDAQLVSVFADLGGDYTVFAPTNDAFNKLLAAENGISSFDDLSDEALDKLLKHHVVQGSVFSSDLSDGQMVETLAGTMLEVDITDGVVTVGGAQVTAVDVEASNGVIHVISDVMVTTEALTIAQVAISNPSFTTLVSALSQAELVATFSNADADYTVFAPTNEAFTAAEVSLSEVEKMDLQRLLMHHVAEGTTLSTSLSDGMEVATLISTDLNVAVSASGVMIDEANVTAADIKTINGVIHVIDGVLKPTTIYDLAKEAGSFSSLLGALDATELTSLVDMDGTTDYTVFAPTDDAFEMVDLTGLSTEYIARILAHHVVENTNLSGSLENGQMVTTLAGTKLEISKSEGVQVGRVNVVQADLVASNGVIHVVDEVLLPNTIYDVAMRAGSFTSLLGALEATDLASTFNMDGDMEYTVFAPTDDAFSNVDVSTLTIEELANVLKHHVVSSKVLSTALSDGQMVTTLAGTTLTVSISDNNTVMIGNATVSTANVEASNGVIHIIDTVLLP